MTLSEKMKKAGGWKKMSSGSAGEEALTQGMKINDMRYLSVTVSLMCMHFVTILKIRIDFRSLFHAGTRRRTVFLQVEPK